MAALPEHSVPFRLSPQTGTSDAEAWGRESRCNVEMRCAELRPSIARRDSWIKSRRTAVQRLTKYPHIISTIPTFSSHNQRTHNWPHFNWYLFTDFRLWKEQNATLNLTTRLLTFLTITKLNTPRHKKTIHALSPLPRSRSNWTSGCSNRPQLNSRSKIFVAGSASMTEVPTTLSNDQFHQIRSWAELRLYLAPAQCF